MGQKAARTLFPILITLTLFSLWAGFALLVVNKFFYEQLPGYTIGRLCIWELVALIIAALLTKLLIDKWGNIEIKEIEGKRVLTFNQKYGVYFGVYFLLTLAVCIWQFWIFSQKI